MPRRSNLVGTRGRVFAEPLVAPDERSFMVANTDAAYYQSDYYKQHKDQVEPVPALRVDPPRMALADIVGADTIAAYEAERRLSFHAVGDTGASSSAHIPGQAQIADAMTADLEGATPPAFLFHLGDVIYNFGEVEYYYDQFYEPFRNYDRPILAIPGNHDGIAKYGQDPKQPLYPSLLGFQRNFCTHRPARSPDAGSLTRSTMTQPGVYFVLDAPFVSIIGLYTNVLEGPGIISAQGTAYPQLDDRQVDFLAAELQRLAADRKALRRAVIVVCHHPPASADAKSGGAEGLSLDIDRACDAAGFLPDAVLSGHAHLYQRFTRAHGGRTIPYVVAGSGGHNVSKPKDLVDQARAPMTWGEFSLLADPILEYGYLTVTVDMTSNAPTLTISFSAPGNPQVVDATTVDLKSGGIMA